MHKQELKVLSLGLNYAVPKKSSLNDHIDIILSLENWLARIKGEEEKKNYLWQRI